MESILLDTFDMWCAKNQFKLCICCDEVSRLKLEAHMNGVKTPIEFLERFWHGIAYNNWEMFDKTGAYDFCAYQFVKEFNIIYYESVSSSALAS